MTDHVVQIDTQDRDFMPRLLESLFRPGIVKHIASETEHDCALRGNTKSEYELH